MKFFFIKVIQNFMEINLCFIHFFEITCWRELSFIKKFLKRHKICLVWFVLTRQLSAPRFCRLVFVASSWLPEVKLITNFLSCFKEFLDEEELCPASYFKDFTLINVIQDWKMKSFYQKGFHLIFSVSYVSIYGKNRIENSKFF